MGPGRDGTDKTTLQLMIDIKTHNNTNIYRGTIWVTNIV